MLSRDFPRANACDAPLKVNCIRIVLKDSTDVAPLPRALEWCVVIRARTIRRCSFPSGAPDVHPSTSINPDFSSLKRKRGIVRCVLRLRFTLQCAVFWVNKSGYGARLTDSIPCAPLLVGPSAIYH